MSGSHKAIDVLLLVVLARNNLDFMQIQSGCCYVFSCANIFSICRATAFMNVFATFTSQDATAVTYDLLVDRFSIGALKTVSLGLYIRGKLVGAFQVKLKIRQDRKWRMVKYHIISRNWLADMICSACL